MSVTEIQSVAEYNQLIQGQPKVLIVLDFTASWCRACVGLAPYLEQIQMEYPTIIVKKVDVDAFAEIADAYQITALPTIVLVKNGRICDKVVGNDVSKLYRSIEKNM